MAPRPSIPELMARLRSSDVEVRRQAMLGIADVAAQGNPATQAALVAAGAVEALALHLSDRETREVKTTAALALCPLTQEPAGAAAVLAAGAVPGLVETLKLSLAVATVLGPLSTDGPFGHIARGVAHLARAAGAAAALLEAGALPVLAEALHSGRAFLVFAAAVALNDLAASADSPEPFVPVVPPLVGCLRAADPGTRTAAADALGNVCGSPAARAAMLAVGGVPSLLQLVRSGNADTAAAAARAVGRLTSGDAACSRAVVAAGGLPDLLALLQPGGSHAAESAIGALYSVARGSPEARSAVAAAGGIPVAVRLVGSSNGVMVERAVLLLALLAAVAPGLRSEILGAGATPALEQLLSRGSVASEQARRWAADALQSLQLESAGAGVESSSAAGTAVGASAAQQQHQQQQHDASQPPPPKHRKVCAAPGCGATRGLRLCGGCGTVRYCSEACSRAHWREHRAECRRLQAAAAATAQQPAGQT